MRLLIIGCGYLGLRVARKWLAAGETVHALTRSVERAQEWHRQGLSPLVGDVLKPESLVFPELDAVLHAVGWDRKSSASQREVYIDGLRNVLERLPPTTQRFMHISSTSVYGQNSGEEVDEQSPTEPQAENGKVCLEAQQQLELWASGHPECRATTLRLSGIYGPDRLLSRVATLQAGQVFTGNPEAWLNLIHVEDAASAIDGCLRSENPGKLYLISDDCPVPRQDYYNHLARLVGAPEPRFEALTDQTRLQLNKRCHNQLAKRELGWQPRFPNYREGLQQALSGERRV